MKKLICLILGLLLVVMPVTAFASGPEEEAGPSEILFRGIPWGTTYAEVLTDFNEFDLKETEPYISSFLSVPKSESTKINVYSNGYSVSDDHGAGFEQSESDYNDGVCTVAGYTVKNVEYGFIFPVDTDTGYVNTDVSSAKLYNGHYSFNDMNDATAMVEDLIGKLSSLYGDVKETDQNTYSNGDTRKYYLWEDGAGNWIILTHIAKAEEPDSIFIDYYSGQIFDWMAELTAGYSKEEADTFVAPTGTEGL